MFKLIDRLNHVIGRSVAWCMVLSALLTVTMAALGLGHAFDIGTLVLQASVIYLHGMAFMLAMPYTLKQRGHVRMVLTYGRLSSRHQSLSSN